MTSGTAAGAGATAGIRGDRQRGMVTVETALALLALVFVAAGMTWVVSVVALHARCVDAARDTARAVARGRVGGRQPGGGPSECSGRIGDRHPHTQRSRDGGRPRRRAAFVAGPVAAASDPRQCSRCRRARTRRVMSPTHRASGTQTSRNRESGSGTIWVLAMALILVMSGVVAATVASVAGAGRRADTAADLAALSAAARLPGPSGSACLVALRVVHAHRAQLAACSVTGEQVQVAVEVNVAGLGGLFVVRSRARAGPGAYALLLRPVIPDSGRSGSSDIMKRFRPRTMACPDRDLT